MTQTPDQHPDTAQEPTRETIRAHAQELRAAHLAAEAGLSRVLEAPDQTKGAALMDYLTATREMSAYAVKHHAELRGLSWAEAVLPRPADQSAATARCRRPGTVMPVEFP